MQTITIDLQSLSINAQANSIVDPWLPRIQNNDEYLQLGLTFAPRKDNTGSCNNRSIDTDCVAHVDGGESTTNECKNFKPLGDLGAVRLASALQCNNRLLSLNLSGNNIGNTGAEALAKALYRSVESNNRECESRTALQVLDLSTNRISFDGAKALGEALRYNTSLRTLDLSFNEISQEGVVELLTRGLNVNSSLKRLSLIGNLHLLSGNQISEMLQSISFVLRTGYRHLESLEIHSKGKDNRGSKCYDSFFGGARDEDLWNLLLALYGTSASRYTSGPYSGLHENLKVKHHRLRTLTLPDSKESIPTTTKGARLQLDQVLHFNAFYHPVMELRDHFDLPQPRTMYFDPTLPYHLQRDVHSGALIGLLPSPLTNNTANNDVGSSRDNFTFGVGYIAMPQVLSFAARRCELNTLWNLMRYRTDVFRYAGRGFQGKERVVVECEACGTGGCLLS